MPVETRAMRRAREAQDGIQAAAETAATMTTTAPRAPRKKATGSKGAKGTKSKGEVKGRKSVDKVQKSTRVKKGGIKAVSQAKQKGKGKKVADEDEVEDQEPEAESNPEPELEFVTKGKAKGKKVAEEAEKDEPKPGSVRKGKGKGKSKGKGEVKGAKGVNKVQKSTKPKKGGIKAVWKAKQKVKGKKVTDEAELEDQKAVGEGPRKAKEIIAAKVEKQVQTADKGTGKEKALVRDKGMEGIKQRFTREDLQEAGALESDDVQMPTLTNDIHPVWALEKFHFSGATNKTEHAEAYAAISPALRLASIWMEHSQYEAFWTTMWHGHYHKPGRLMRITQLSDDQAKSLEKNKTEDGLTSNKLRDLASLDNFKCEWRFGPLALGTWAKTEEGIDGVSGCVTTLHDDFEWLALSPQPSTTTSERLRFYFFLALNLGRELVQQVCRFKHKEYYGENAEPLDMSFVFFQSPEGVVPLDVAWENSMFKGSIRQISSPKGQMASDGLAVHHFRQGAPERVYMPVRIDWISERFSMGFWLADDFDEDRTLLGLPNGSDVYAKELVID